MVDRESNGILRQLVAQWEHVQAEVGRLQSTAEARPEKGHDIFRFVEEHDAPDTAKFDLLPVVFNLPERADHHNIDLFVVVKGWMRFDRHEFAGNGVLVTRDFATQVAYFRRTAKALTHVYGGHYDFAVDQLGHPVFHGQIRSYPEFAQHVKDQYSVSHDVVDCVKGMLRNVRVPTAQMDVFSLFVALCADHLLYEQSGPEEREAFNSLLRRSDFCRGAAHRAAHLVTEEARACYRARHWYPAIA